MFPKPMFPKPLFPKPIVVLTLILSPLATLVLSAEPPSGKVLRAGMIGLDTSHVNAFTNIFNDPNATGEVAHVRVVAGYPGGTDIPASRDRVERFTQDLKKKGIEIVDTIPELLEKVDVVLLESVDGRIHLEEAIQVIQARKPLFIDKPVAGSLSDAIAIYELAKRYDVPCFSSSSIRFGQNIQSLLDNDQVGDIIGCSTWGPCTYQEGTPDMFFYGIHGIEGLFTVMGPGCVSVTRATTDGADHLTGVWSGGRIGTFRGLRRGKSGYGVTAFGSQGIVTVGRSGGYEQLCQQIAVFFQTGKPPVSPEETLEIFAFMEAADESKRLGGIPVKLAEVLARARKEAFTKIAR